MNDLLWSTDSLMLRSGTFFGFGWVFHKHKEIRELWLTVRFGDRTPLIIPADFGRPRPDVAASFAQCETALYSGYLLFGSQKDEISLFSNISLNGKFEDGVSFEIEIPRTSVMSVDRQHKIIKRVLIRQAVTFLNRAWLLIKSGQFISLIEKGKRYLRGSPKILISHPETIQSKLTAKERESIALMIDHDLGGGANLYRERLVAQRIDAGQTVLIFSYHIVTLSYVLMVRSKRLNERFAIPGYDFLLVLAELLEIKEIIYNTGVSFVQSEEIPQLIAKIKNHVNPHLTLLVHDFFMVCPSHFLLDDTGAFCGIPEISRCHDCLSKNQQGFASLYQSRDMHQWRALWGSVIGLADEIIAFSHDTLKLLKRAYPSLDLSRTSIKPHTLEHMSSVPVRLSNTSSLKIGVVGQIGFHKGAKFIQELANEIKTRRLDTKIVIVGTLEVKSEKSVVQQTGPYQHYQLPELIESTGINVMLFPSIWPETFSFVVQELIELDLPVACFDLGAPAERLSNYAKGLILKERNASSVLDALISFHHQIYS